MCFNGKGKLLTHPLQDKAVLCSHSEGTEDQEVTPHVLKPVSEKGSAASATANELYPYCRHETAHTLLKSFYKL